MEKATLVIGDVHGHFDRLHALLEQEGIIDAKGKRINFDVNVIQLGDLGHFGDGGSPTGDKLCYLFANDWFDGVCWGNHDRPNVDGGSVFNGYQRPSEDTLHSMKELYLNGKLRFAFAANGYLLTHAGLHPVFKDCPADPEKAAEWVNTNPHCWHPIGRRRNGRHEYGGVLWRDASEKLRKDIPQVFGHSRGPEVREYNGNSYCVDVGTPGNGRLAAIWLPSCRVAEVEQVLQESQALPV